MHNSVAKKIFAVGVAASTALMGLAPFVASAAVHAAGTNVKSSDGTIWMIMPDNTRRAYTSAGAFLSYGFNSFSSVVDASAEDLALPAGSFIPPQDGKVICSDRGADKGTCYLISSGMKAGFTSAAVFTGLGFSFSRATYGDVSWMSSTSNIDNTTSPHLPGVLINNGGTVQLRGTSSNLGIPDIATFNTWGYSFADVVPANASDKAITQAGVMAARVPGQLSPSFTTNPNNPNNPPVSGPISASLASDNPAATSIVASSSAVTLAKFVFSGNGTVTNVSFKRIGVSSDTTLSNVYLYDGSTRLTDAASVSGSSMINFANASGLFTVSGTRTISVVAEISGSATAGQTVGVELSSYTPSGNSPVNVTISGNQHTVVAVSDLASVDFGTVTPSGSSFDPAADVEVFRTSVSVGTRDVTLSRLSIRQIGSINNSDITNFRLRIDGSQVAQVGNMTSDGYVNFSFSPVTIKSGSRIVSVLADIVGGSNRNFQFSIRNKVDVNFTDSNYNVVIAPVDTFPVGQASSNSITTGAVTVAKATDSPSADVIDGASDVSLGKYTITAYGEALKIETIKVAATSSDTSVGSLRNGRVLINGSQYGSTQTLTTNTNSGTSYTLNYTVQPGTPVTLEIRADIHDNDGTDNLGSGDTVTAYVIAGSSNAQRMTSLGYINAPSAAVAGNSISVTAGSVTLVKNTNYANQTTTLPQTMYKVGSFNLSGSSAEDVNVSSIDLSIASGSSTVNFDWDNMSDVQVKVNGNLFGSVKATIGDGSTLLSASSTFSGNYTLTKNTTVPVEVFATLNVADVDGGTASSSAVSTITPNLVVNGTTASSGASIVAATQGQTITYGSAAISAAKSGASASTSLVDDSQTRTAAAFEWTTTNDTYTISEVTISLGSNSTVQNIILKDGSTVLGTKPGAASTTFTGLSVVVPPNSNKTLTVDLQLGTVGAGAGTSGENVAVTLHSFKHVNSAGTQATPVEGDLGNAQYVVKAVPTITALDISGNLTNINAKDILKFSVSTNGTGTIGWKKFIFTYSTSTGVTLASPTLWNADTNEEIAGTGTLTAGSISFVATNEEQISGTTNYVLRANVGGATDSGDYLTVSIAAPSSDLGGSGATAGTDNDYATVAGGTATFVWTDRSASGHSASTFDWYADYLVKNLPNVSESLSVP